LPTKAASKKKSKSLRSPDGQDEAQALTPEQMMAEINKAFGEGTMILGSDPILKIKRIPTGILGLDVGLKGGFTRGRHIEIYGGENIGKTTIAYMIAASAQALGGTAVMCDLEGTYDPEYAASLGVNIKKLGLHRQKKGHGEKAFDFVETVVRRAKPDVMIIDTIAALLPKAEYESQLDTGTFGTDQARLMSKALRKLTAANESTVFVWLNQTRQVVGAGLFAKQTTTSGGRAMGFYAATRLEVVRTETLKVEKKRTDPATGEKRAKKVAVGHRALIRITKDKTGSAKPDAEVPLVYSYKTNRFDELEDIMYLGREAGMIKKKNAMWWVVEYEDEKSNGRPAFKRWLRKNRAVCDELKEAIVEHFNEATEEDDDDA
jgi:recombination protein RecA